MPSPSLHDIAQMIDHALLAPTLTTRELEAGIDLAIQSEVASVCILPHYVKDCARRTQGTSVKVSTTIGFPHGSNSARAKLFEAQNALDNGCEEIDMVVNISRVLSNDWAYVRADISDICEAAHLREQKVKVIFENCYLKDIHQIKLAELCSELQADWIKTSTGFGSSGAKLSDVKQMRRHAAPTVGIKASGGIGDLDTLLAFRAAGASRIGTSHSSHILGQARTRFA